MFCDNAVEPLNPTPVFDIVTPVPWFNIKEFSNDIVNISFVCSPNSDAFDDKSTFLPSPSTNVFSVLSLIISFLGVKYFCVVVFPSNVSGKMYPYRFTLKVV